MRAVHLASAVVPVLLLSVQACSGGGGGGGPPDGGGDVGAPVEGGGQPDGGGANDGAAKDGSGGGGGDAGGGLDAGMATPGFPQVPRGQADGGVFAGGLRVVTIVPSNYGIAADETQLDAWGDYVVTSPWLKTVAAQYGAPTSGTSAHLSGPAITDATYTNALAEAYLASLVATDAGAAYAPDGHTFYAMYVPPGTAFSQTYCGYHFKLSTGHGDAVALIRVCTEAGLTSLQNAMVTAGHELVEAITDTPGGAGWILNDATLEPPALTPWAYQENTNGTPHSELGDLCGGTRWSENGMPFTRIWSNQAAAAGGDPCAPAVAQPYYNVKTAVSWVPTAAGQTATIPLTGWTRGGTTTDWVLTASEAADSEQSATNTGSLVAPTLTSATTATVAGKAVPTINDGKAATLAIPVPASAPHGAWAAVQIKSAHLDAAGKPVLDPDVAHSWFVGIVVP